MKALIDALRIHHDWSIRNIPGYSESGDERVAYRATVAALATERTDLCPGVMRCAKCEFRLLRTTLYMGSGTTGPGSSETEPCPNGCGPLWPVTWEEEARERGKFAEQMLDRAVQAEKSLADAVPLYSVVVECSRLQGLAAHLRNGDSATAIAGILDKIAESGLNDTQPAQR